MERTLIVDTDANRAKAAYDEINRRLHQYDEALPLLKRAMEELRLIRMKDCRVVYDTILRVDYALFTQKWQIDP